MPLTGLTWARLKEHLRKCGAIYAAGIVICVLVTNLLYTTTRPQTPMEQEVLIYLVDAYSNPEPLDALAQDALAYGQSVDETLLELRFETILYNDPEQDYTSSMLLMARMSTGEGDAYLASEVAAQYMMGSGICMPLDDYLADGWLADAGLEPVTYTDPETGETYTAGLKLDSVSALSETGSFNNEGACLFIASNSTNVETTLETVEYIINELLEGYHAPAESTEPAA